MSSFEVLAIMPESGSHPPEDALQFLNAGGYTVVLAATARKIMTLPQSRKTALVEAAQRQHLLEACMAHGTVLVMRPQFFMHPDDIETFVAANRPLFDKLTQQLCQKVQYQVTVGWDASGVLARFRDAPELAPIFDAGRASSTALQTGVATLAHRLGTDIDNALMAASDDLISLPSSQDMLNNSVVLVDSEKTEHLDRAVEKIDDIWTEGFQIKLIGPAPAASFALLDPQDVTPAQISLALQQFELTTLPSADRLIELRKTALRSMPHNAETIRRSAAILAAASRIGASDRAFTLCTVRVEGQTASDTSRAVA